MCTKTASEASPAAPGAVKADSRRSDKAPSRDVESSQSQLHSTMLAGIFVKPGRVELRQRRAPEPSDDELLIRMEGCGLCASNLPPWEGREWFNYPMEAGSPGHEGWGVVERTGNQVETFKPGDRVTAVSHHAFSEYDIAKADHTVALPPPLDDRPFPGEPLGCAMNIFARSGIRPGMTVAIVGAGFLGLLLLQLAKDAGARVIVLSRRRSSLKMARRFGADGVFSVHESSDETDRAIRHIKEVTENNLCDCVIEATGAQEPLNLAAQLTAIRGKLIIAGYHQEGLRQVDMQLWNWRGIDVINAHERDPSIYTKGIRQAVKAVEANRIDPFPLFTHIFPQEKIQQAFKTHQKKPEGFTKALITFS